MPQCDITIEFDRPDGEYRVGYEVTGVVHVRVSEDVMCRRFAVERYWRTHGKGTKDTGGRRVLVVERDLAWRAGEHHEFPFRFQAPTGPFTYRGYHVNVDHYVAARADVPWKLDPKADREYLLLPGSPEPVKHRSTKPAVFKIAHESSDKVVPLALGTVAIMLFTIPLLPFALVVWIAMPTFLFFRYRTAIAEQRLGNVSVQLGSQRVSPGERLSIRIGFRPHRPVEINRITAKLEGVERCTSGSGSDRQHHKHQLHQQEIILCRGTTVDESSPFELRESVAIPRTQAYSFSSDNNHVTWKLGVRIDIPRWPDWIHTADLTLRPGPATVQTFEETPPAPAQLEAPPRPSIPPPPRRVAASPPAPARRSGGVAGSTPAPDGSSGPGRLPPLPRGLGPKTPAESSGPVVEALARIAGTDRFGGERQRLIDEMGGQAFEFEAAVERVEWTVSFDVDEAFRGGRTVVATVAHANAAIALLFGKTENATIDVLKSGQIVEVTGRFVGWNAFHGRAEIAVSDYTLGV